MTAQEHVEAAIEQLVKQVVQLTRDDLMKVSVGLQAGWLTQHERERLEPLSDAFRKLSEV